MNKLKIIVLIVILISCLFMVSSCDTVAVYGRPGYGPPAHAPAHGLRAKQPKTVVIMDVHH